MGALVKESFSLTSPEPKQLTDPMWEFIQRASSDPTFDVQKLKELLALRDKELARQEERSFFQALHLAQEEVPAIEPNKQVKTSSGKVMFEYASYEQLDKALRPIYIKHGMAIAFSGAEAPAGKVRVLCTVSHRDGHAERYQLDLAIDPGAAQLTKTDAELGAQSKAKRRILRNIFNIVDDLEDEAGMTNGELAEQIEWLENANNPAELKRLYNQAANLALDKADKNAIAALKTARAKKEKEFNAN